MKNHIKKSAALVIVGTMLFINTEFNAYAGTTIFPPTIETVRNVDYLMLVNAAHHLPEGFEPELVSVGFGQQMDPVAAEALELMLQDAKTAGVRPKINSTYRSVKIQDKWYQEEVERVILTGLSESDACVKAATKVAAPGTSEHATGLAVDLSTRIPNGEWFVENCYNYGFILRYPADKTDITGIIHEPWHFRYVGVEAATSIMEQGICLEEYLGQ
jgi:D-alanyl-D-alanine carboxypeptidase